MFQRASENFSAHGFALLPGILEPQLVAALKSALTEGVLARKETFLHVPPMIDVLRRHFDATEDPGYAAFKRKWKERRRQKRQLSPKKQTQYHSNDHDVWAMSEKIAQMIVKRSPVDTDIGNDPQRLKAIDDFKVNVWMTNRELRQLIHGDLGKSVGEIVTNVAGISTPRLFCDRPFFREAYCRPSFLHFAAPFIGIDHPIRDQAICGIWIFCNETTAMRCPISYLEKSHIKIRAIYSQKDPLNFTSDFVPVDSDTSLWLRHFPEFAQSCTSCTISPIPVGSVLLFDPFLFVGMGPNFSSETNISWQLFAIPESATPSLRQNSWIRGWRTSGKEISFHNEVIFPKLFT